MEQMHQTNSSKKEHKYIRQISKETGDIKRTSHQGGVTIISLTIKHLNRNNKSVARTNEGVQIMGSNFNIPTQEADT